MIGVGIDQSLLSSGATAVDQTSLQGQSKAYQMGKKLRGVLRLRMIVAGLLDFVKTHQPGIICMEGYNLAPTAVIRGRLADLAELGGCIKMALWPLGYRQDTGTLMIVPPMSLKKFATGVGNADKEHVVAVVAERWGFRAKTDDEVDAFVLGVIALALAGAYTDLTDYQRDVLAVLRGEVPKKKKKRAVKPKGESAPAVAKKSRKKAQPVESH